MTRYQVVGECAHVVVTDISGMSAMNLLYKGAPIPEGAEPKRLKHLIDSGLVAEEGTVPLAPNAAVEQDPAVGIPTGVEADKADGVHPAAPTEEQLAAQREQAAANTEAEQKQAAARAKLAEIGGTPDGRSSEAVWVEFAVQQGTDRAEAEKAGKTALMDLYKK